MGPIEGIIENKIRKVSRGSTDFRKETAVWKRRTEVILRWEKNKTGWVDNKRKVIKGREKTKKEICEDWKRKKWIKKERRKDIER